MIKIKREIDVRFLKVEFQGQVLQKEANYFGEWPLETYKWRRAHYQ